VVVVLPVEMQAYQLQLVVLAEVAVVVALEQVKQVRQEILQLQFLLKVRLVGMDTLEVKIMAVVVVVELVP
jgi:hypothetical protein